jgi:hypothetical protein
MKKKHWIIPIANKIGLFPSARQSSSINCRATALLLKKNNGVIPKINCDAPEDNPEFLECLHAAIREVMAEAKPSPRRMHGIPRGRIITIGVNGIEHVQANNQ